MCGARFARPIMQGKKGLSVSEIGMVWPKEVRRCLKEFTISSLQITLESVVTDGHHVVLSVCITVHNCNTFEQLLEILVVFLQKLHLGFQVLQLNNGGTGLSYIHCVH